MKKLLMMFAMFMIVGLLYTGDVWAADNSAQTYRIQLFDEPQSIKLPKADTSYWFSVPAATEVKEALLSIVLKTSDTLLEDYSTATVELNGIAVASVNLLDLQKNDNKWEVKLPVELLKTDGSMNQLSIVTAQRSILGECADIDNPANWVLISDESALLLTLVRSDEFVLSDLYPFVFNRAELGNAINTGMVMAGSDVEAEGSAALTIASSIGANFPYKDIKKLTIGETAGKKADSIFEIDADHKLEPRLAAGEGYLGIGSEDRVKVEVAGGGKEGLKKAVGMLTDADMLSQFGENSTVIQSDHSSVKDALAAREDGLYILRDFGYDNLNLAGAFHQQTYFTIRQPDGILGGPGSYFEVHFRHSDALIGDTSLLTVFFDGVPATSVQLSGTNVDDGVLRVKIPKESLSKGSFEISIDVYNYLGKIDCSKDWYDVAWTLIDGDSIIYLEPSDNTVTPSLANFPSMWGGDTVACIPKGSSDTLMQAMVTFAARNGQNTKLMSDYKLTHKISDQDVSDANIVIAGKGSNINLPDVIARELYITPTSDGWEIRKDIDTVLEVLEGKIIVQAVRSPYNFRRMVYVIMWSDKKGEKIFANLMKDNDRLSSLSGQVALLGDHSAVSIKAKDAVEEEIPLSPQVVIAKAVRMTGIPFTGLVIIAILVLVILLLIIRQLRSKNRFDDAKTKVQQENEEIREEMEGEDRSPEDASSEDTDSEGAGSEDADSEGTALGVSDQADLGLDDEDDPDDFDRD
ncbi:MAG: cellulose biosynthesis cyclic di-GMP-binding regulatory protein BcsB [Lachnospiraceae bacterium]|nr:cellulose biosynthesis cyclic di-GMP-binding regulatory protein BcsB [Lachnospiraceae bacterium]